jgi:predicted  nucleic acid-binding Zn-ribbon protein
MERRPDKHVSTAEWQAYLQAAFEQNKPYDQLVREILSSDGTDPALRPAAKFLLDRDAEPHSSSRDVGRMFFGMDLQCAQCHDHPLVDHYLQSDYYGLFAFLNRTEVFTDAGQKKSFLSEKAHGDASYKSVFTGDAANTRPQLPGAVEIDEPYFHQGEEYVTAPAANVRSVPKFSRRARLAELATNGTNRQFNLNIANRLWAVMMGRGLVHPVDLHHPANPPSHPAVLDAVSNDFVLQKYNIKWLLRELALTRTYQRSIDPPADPAPQVAAAAQQVPVVDAELNRLKGVAEESRKQSNAIRDELKTARTALEPLEAAWKKAEAAVTEAKKPVDAATAALVKSQGDANAKQAVINTINEAAAKSAEAAKALPNDKDVAAVVATFTAKQQQLGTELAAIQKTIADQTAAQQAAQAKLVESYAPADAAYAAFVEGRKPVDAIKARLLVAWTQHQSDSLAVTLQKKRLDSLQSHVAYGTALAQAAVSKAAIEPAKAELVAAAQAAEQQQLEVTRQTAAVAEIEKASVEATRQLEEVKAQYTAKQAVVQSVAEAAAKADAALQKIPGDAELTAIVQKLKERQEPLVKEASVLEQSVAGKDAALKEVTGKVTAMKQVLTAASTELANRQQVVTAKTNGVNQSIAAAQAAEGAIATSRNQLVDAWTATAAIRPLKHLAPEQLGWSVMQATGVVEPQRPGIDAEIEKTNPKAAVMADPVKLRARDLQVEALLFEKNRGNLSAFVSMYGQSAGQPQDDFFATPDQALFVANGGSVIGWSAGGQLAQRLNSMAEPNVLIDELYLSVLTRRPTDSEVAEMTAQLAARPTEKNIVVRDMIWALVTSAEFRFNH